MLNLGPQAYSYADFTETSSGRTCAILTDGITGAGSDRTFIDLTGPINTTFPVYKNWDTTRYNVIRVQAAHRLVSPVLKGFTVRVSAPVIAGQLYNGIRVAAADGLLVEDVRIVGVPGTGNFPPWETFGLDLLDCPGYLLRGVSVDGHGIGGAGIGINKSAAGVLDGCHSSHSGSSHGFTVYQSNGVTFIGCTATDNGNGTGASGGVGFNHEDSPVAVHRGSATYRNSLASMRFYAATKSTVGHQLIGCYGDAPILTDTAQLPSDIDASRSTFGVFTHR